jgi:hypothetical protein
MKIISLNCKYNANSNTTALFSLAKSQSKPYIIESTGAEKPESSQLHLISFNCKNIKTCGPIIYILLQFNAYNWSIASWYSARWFLLPFAGRYIDVK